MAGPTSKNNTFGSGGAPGRAPAPPSKSKPKAQTADVGFNVDALQPPPGVPQSFWQHEILDNPNNAAGLQWLTDPTKGGGFDRFKNKAEYLKFLQQGVEQTFSRLPESKKQEYVQADANGGIDPDSVEGHVQERNKLIDEAEAKDKLDFEGVDPAALESALRSAASGDQAALENLNQLISGIKDPELAQYVGDYAAHLGGPDQRDVDAQSRQLAKLEGLSDPTITAEEKLMMEMARRQTESDLKGQRGAIANNLQARGMYGSGAELTMNLAAQQEAAQRQALEMLGAQSNAQKRAMDALYGAKDLATSMRGSSAQESQFNANALNTADEFNKKMREAYDSWKDRTMKENNDRMIGRQEKIAANVGQIGAGGVKAEGAIYDMGAERAAKKASNRNTYLTQRLEGEDTLMNDDDRTTTEKKVKL